MPMDTIAVLVIIVDNDDLPRPARAALDRFLGRIRPGQAFTPIALVTVTAR